MKLVGLLPNIYIRQPLGRDDTLANPVIPSPKPAPDKLSATRHQAREHTLCSQTPAMTIFFLGVLWTWSRSRPALSASERTGSDLQMLGHVFFLIAAWYLCGVFGAPMFALRPELAEQFAVSASASASLASLISICLATGWACTFLGHRMVLHSRRESRV